MFRVIHLLGDGQIDHSCFFALTGRGIATQNEPVCAKPLITLVRVLACSAWSDFLVSAHAAVCLHPFCGMLVWCMHMPV